MFLPNIDTLIFSALTETYNQEILQLHEHLDSHQELAKQTNKNVTIFLGGQSFELLPNGARMYKYILHNNKYEIKLQQLYNERSSNYPIFIRLKSEFLWELRDQAYHESIAFIELLLGKVTQVKMSRVDLCCHTEKIEMNKLDINRFVTRSTYKEQHIDNIENSNKVEVYRTGLEVTGLSFGKSPIRLRIYDKNLEIIQSSKKTWFKEIWSEHGVTENDTVVNVEFQLNREFFKAYGIDTYEQLNNEILSIWQYLTEKWIRYVKKGRTRNKNAEVESFWYNIQHAYDIDWKSYNGIQRQKQKTASEQHLLNMIRCYMINHASLKGITDYMEYAMDLFGNVDQLIQDKHIDFESEVKKKILLG